MYKSKRVTASQKRKEMLQGELFDVRARILEAASSLPLNKQDEVFLGTWSVKDLLAHLAGWDETNMRAVEEFLAGKLPSFYAYADKDWATYNAKLVAEYKREDFDELLTLVKATHRKLLDYLETILAVELERDRDIRYKGWIVTPYKLLMVEKKDEEKHYDQLYKFINEVKV